MNSKIEDNQYLDFDNLSFMLMFEIFAKLDENEINFIFNLQNDFLKKKILLVNEFLYDNEFNFIENSFELSDKTNFNSEVVASKILSLIPPSSPSDPNEFKQKLSYKISRFIVTKILKLNFNKESLRELFLISIMFYIIADHTRKLGVLELEFAYLHNKIKDDLIFISLTNITFFLKKRNFFIDPKRKILSRILKSGCLHLTFGERPEKVFFKTLKLILKLKFKNLRKFFN